MSRFAPWRPDDRGAPAPDLSVRPAARSDVHDLARIWAARHGGDPAEAAPKIHREFTAIAEGRAARYVCAATIGGAVVGYGKCGRYEAPADAPAGWYLLGVVVDPAARRRGAGRALTRHRMDWLDARGVGEVFYFANAQNPATVALHRPFGFAEVARVTSCLGVTFTGGEGVLLRASLG